MKRILISWLGDNDLKAVTSDDPDNLGSVGDFLAARGDAYSHVLLLHNRPDDVDRYRRWLSGHLGVTVEHLGFDLPAPHDFDAVFEAVHASLPSLLGPRGPLPEGRDYLLSSGTKAMTAALMLLASTSLPGRMFFNRQRREGEDSRAEDRILEVHWQERFGLSLWLLDPSRDIAPDPVPGCDSSDPEVRRIYRLATELAPTPLPVVILGETGTGKERLARHLHERSGRRGPFVPINCGAIPETLIESELFGARRGAFTGAVRDLTGAFQRANGGTLLLDEIADLPPRAQVGILRALQEGSIRPVGADAEVKVDVRVVAATHRDLRTLVREERFRQDLYYRLAGYVVTLPPLRQRLRDLRDHVERLRAAFEQTTGRAPLRLDEGAWRELERHDWPGNFRELENVVRRCLLEASTSNGSWLVTGQIVSRALGEQSVRRRSTADPATMILDSVEGSDRSLTDHLADLKRRVLELAIRRHGSQRQAARVLGMKPQAVSAFLNRRRPEGVS